jgi:hypothetical protein
LASSVAPPLWCIPQGTFYHRFLELREPRSCFALPLIPVLTLAQEHWPAPGSQTAETLRRGTYWSAAQQLCVPAQARGAGTGRAWWVKVTIMHSGAQLWEPRLQKTACSGSSRFHRPYNPGDSDILTYSGPQEHSKTGPEQGKTPGTIGTAGVQHPPCAPRIPPRLGKGMSQFWSPYFAASC